MTRVLVLGRHGQLARALSVTPWPVGWAAEFAGRDNLDLRRPETIKAFLSARAPDVVINTAAYTAVDAAETDEAAAFALNAAAPGALAEACRADGRLLIHISTDYVFAGDGGAPYGEEAAVAPINVYGRSKAGGERRVLAADPDALIARSSWLLSPDGGFVRAIRARLQAVETVRVVCDQRGSPTSTLELAAALLKLVEARRRGIGAGGLLHVAGAEDATWFEIAHHLAAAADRPNAVIPVESADYPTVAARPADSRLAVTKLRSVYGIELGSWTAATMETA